jgi:hypothetical protein
MLNNLSVPGGYCGVSLIESIMELLIAALSKVEAIDKNASYSELVSYSFNVQYSETIEA